MPISLSNEDMFLPIASGKPMGDVKDSKPEKTLPPWFQPSAKLFRPGCRSYLDGANSLQELWTWLQEKDEKSTMDRSELISADPILRGVALSRFAQAWQNSLEDLLNPKGGWGNLLKPEVYDAVKKEAESLLPHFKVLNGVGMRARESPAKSSMQLGCRSDNTIWRDRDEVEAAATKLLSWMMNSAESKLLGLLEIASQSGLSYCAWVDHSVVLAYLAHGAGKDNFVDDLVARLCQGSPPAKRQKVSGSNPFKQD